MSTLTKPFCRSSIDTCIKKLDILILHDCAVWHDVSWALMWVSFPTCLWHSFLPGKKSVNKLASMDSFFSETERYFSCQVVSLPPLLLSAESPIKEHFAYGNQMHSAKLSLAKWQLSVCMPYGNSYLVTILTLGRFICYAL